MRAEQVARGLEAAGVDVFWDNEIPPGQTWADYIESKLTHCKALIVLWSQTSTKSQWVREEARMGRDKGVLIPAMIDNAVAPFGFGEVQAANLSTWNGADANHPDWRRFVEAVRGAASSAPRTGPQPMPSAPPRVQPAMSSHVSAAPAKKGGVPTWAWIVGGIVGVLILLAVLGSMIPDTSTNTTIAGVDTTQQAMTTPTAPQQAQPAQSADYYQQQILARLSQAEQEIAAQGFQRMGNPYTGQLAQGQSQDITSLTLNVGAEFRVIGVCDADCNDLDLALYDGYGNEISRDNGAAATAVVGVIPTSSGTFGVQVHMYHCARAPCYYALVLYGRPQ